MFRSRRPPTLSINELNHILSESLDFENVPQSIVHHDPLLLTTPKSSTFNRLFSRSLSIASPSPSDQAHRPVTPSPRKMTFTWCFPRLSPRKSPRAEADAKGIPSDLSVPVNPANPLRPLSFASTTQTSQRTLTSMSPSPSSSSLGSMLPASQCVFNHVAEDGVYRETEDVASTTLQSHLSSPSAPPHSPLSSSKSSSNLITPRAITPEHANLDAEKISVSESKDPSNDDVTPRATEFRAIPSRNHSGSTIQAKHRRRPSALTLAFPHKVASLCLQPAVGVAPYVPSDTESSASLYSPSSPTSSTKSPTSTISFLPSSRARSESRSMPTPPLPGPPPSCPLPPPPTLPAQNPPTPSKPQIVLPASPNPSQCSVLPPGMATCVPSSSLGSLRLPSRLSWCATGRIVLPASSLPSPPSSPSKEGRKKEPSPGSLTKDQENGISITTSPTLGKRASIGVLEAASDLDAQMRRTKSILVFGNRRSKGVLSSSDSPPKRVQIHAEANSETVESSLKKKPRRQSSAASTIPFLEVPRERRRSAPLLRSGVTSKGTHIPLTGADWTLSLPFCIDVPGSGIILPTPPSEDGALHEAEEALQVAQGDDWTLSLGADRQTLANAEKGVANDNTQAKVSMEGKSSFVTQLPTPSTTPEPQDDILLLSPPLDFASFTRRSRPASPASLGPHCGGLDLDGGYGKRGSGWDVCEWFGHCDMDEPKQRDMRPVSMSVSMFESEASWIRRSTDTDAPRRCGVGSTRKDYEKWTRHLSDGSTATSGTLDTVYYSARASVLIA